MTMEFELSKTQRKHARKYINALHAMRDEIMGIENYSYHLKLIGAVLLILASFDLAIDKQTQAFLRSVMLGEDEYSAEVMEDIAQGKEYVTMLDKFTYKLNRVRALLIDVAERKTLCGALEDFAREILKEIDDEPDDEEIARAIGRDAKQS